MSPQQPSGTVTMVFTDIEGSTRLLSELGQEAYREALGEHRRQVREAFGRFQGYEVDYEGDAFFYAFASAEQAVAAVQEAMRELERGPIRIRVGIHTGEPGLDPPKYVGIDVHRAARIMSAGHGGQVLVSETTTALLAAELVLSELGSHRLKDFERSVRLYQLGKGDFPPLKTISNTNLPAQASPLVGRERELGELVGRLGAPAVRLMTLTGVGGTGKTRLAVRAAAELADGFPDGVWFVDLAPLRDPELVEPTIGQTLGAKQELTEHLASKQALLVLDNFEQVTEAATVVVRLLAGCPQLKLLVTSRIALQVSGEQLYPVPPLQLEEAVALFGERARALKPGFEPNGAIAEICERLDRLPLAIELAAARIRLLPPRAILARLEQRLSLLTGGARDLAHRQQTLEAAIAWSYELLQPADQLLFAKLAVFNGGRTLEAIEAVCNQEGELDVLAGLQTLVDSSLLNQQETGDGESRFVMLETIHEYAAARLDELADNEELRRRHALFFHALALEAKPELEGAEQKRWLDRLEDEHGNLRTALSSLQETDQTELLLELLNGLFNFWNIRAGWSEPQGWYEHALAASDGQRSPARAWLLLGAEAVLAKRGEQVAGEALLAESLSIFDELGDDRGIGRALINLGSNHLELGRFEEARSAFEEAAVHLDRAEDDYGAALARGNLTDVAFRTGDHAGAVLLAEQAVVRSRELAVPELLGWSFGELALAYLLTGQVELAVSPARESLVLGQRLGDHYVWVHQTLYLSAALAARDNRPEAAASLLGGADALCEDHDLELQPAQVGLVDELRGDLGRELGEERYEALVAEGRQLTIEEAVDLALEAIPAAAGEDRTAHAGH